MQGALLAPSRRALFASACSRDAILSIKASRTARGMDPISDKALLSEMGVMDPMTRLRPLETKLNRICGADTLHFFDVRRPAEQPGDIQKNAAKRISKRAHRSISMRASFGPSVNTASAPQSTPRRERRPYGGRIVHGVTPAPRAIFAAVPRIVRCARMLTLLPMQSCSSTGRRSLSQAS